MPKDEPISPSNSDSNIQIRQLQQYLHRPGKISAAPHPFIKKATKQVIRQSAGHWEQQQYSPPPWQRIAQW